MKAILTNSNLDPQDPNHDLAHVGSDEPTGPTGETAYDGWGGCYPGDGSGFDDLADYNQNEADDYCDE